METTPSNKLHTEASKQEAAANKQNLQINTLEAQTIQQNVTATENEDLLDLLNEWVQQVAVVATKLEFMVTAVLLIGACSVAAIGSKLYTPDGLLWWNIIKIGVFVLPLLIWFVFWTVIRQLVDGPQEMAEIATDDDNVIGSTFEQMREISFKEPKGVFSLLRSVRQLRKTDGLEMVFDTVSGIALLANPIFALAVVLSLLASIEYCSYVARADYLVVVLDIKELSY